MTTERFKHKHLDGKWDRTLADGTLEMRDPNSGLGFDPESKPRFQYRVHGNLLLTRRFPPASVGDRWRDDEIDEPWWEPVQLPPSPSILRDYFEHEGGDFLQFAYLAQVFRHVVAYTPNGREVRMRTYGTMEVQPHNDNFWIRVPDLKAARRAYFRPSEFYGI